MRKDAGVEAVPAEATPGDASHRGHRRATPSGIPVPEDKVRRVLEGTTQRHASVRPGGPRGGGPRGPRQGGGVAPSATTAPAARAATARATARRTGLTTGIARPQVSARQLIAAAAEARINCHHIN